MKKFLNAVLTVFVALLPLITIGIITWSIYSVLPSFVLSFILATITYSTLSIALNQSIVKVRDKQHQNIQNTSILGVLTGMKSILLAYKEYKDDKRVYVLPEQDSAVAGGFYAKFIGVVPFPKTHNETEKIAYFPTAIVVLQDGTMEIIDRTRVVFNPDKNLPKQDK